MGGGVRLSLLKSLYRSSTRISSSPSCRRLAEDTAIVRSSSRPSPVSSFTHARAIGYGYGSWIVTSSSNLNAKPFPLLARAFSSQPDGTDWVHKAKDVFYETANKAKEASDELTPHVQQLLDANPYLKEVMVPVSLTMTGTLFAWVVMPKVLRRFHSYSMRSSAALLPQGFSIDDVPYDKSFWGALEDPARYLMTFIAFAQIASMVAPTTVAAQYFFPALKGAVILSLVWFLHRWKTNVITRVLSAKNVAGLDREKILTLDKVSSVGLFAIGLMASAEACGVAVQSILTVGGVGGVATAFAARDILGNVLSGLSMQFSRPFSMGDTIKAGSVEGQVVEMGLTTTSLLNAEKFPVLVPNSLFSSQVIVNKSRAQWRAIASKIPLQIDDLDKIPHISDEIKETLRSNPKVFLGKEAPHCYLSRVEKSSAELTIGCNLKYMGKEELYATQQEVLLESVKIIKKHGASLGPPPPPNSDPYPPQAYPPPLHNQYGSMSHSGPLDYAHRPPPPLHHHYGSMSPSGPPPHYSYDHQHQPHPPQQPTLQPHARFASYPPPPQHPHHDNFSSAGYSSPPVYPPLHDLMGGLTVSSHHHPPSSNPGSYHGQQPYHSFSSHSHLSHSGRLDSPLPHSPSLQIVPSGKPSLKVLLLHGNLDIWIYRANNLPNMDLFHNTLGAVFGSISNMIEGQLSKKITSDPYVSISVAGAVIGRTYVMSNSENPVWHQHFYVPVAHHAAEVHFVVKDSDVVGSQLIGLVTIPVEQIHSGARIEGTYSILSSNGKPCKPGATLTLSIQYTSADKLSVYHSGVGGGPSYQGVPGTYFPLREGGNVTLYQDAHVPEGMLPRIRLGNGMYYENGKCWHDMFHAICQARRLIYITGWSVWHNVRLARDKGNPASECTLGELLKSKSREGVRVLLLVWDDPTSRDILGYKTDGVMGTHDEETRRFFKHSSVQILLCPRNAGKRHSWVKQTEVGTIYTHHQKTLIVDADAGGNRRKIVAFVGGLDLCDGRYDTPQHPLFRTLQTDHKGDYHNPTFTGNLSGCPREPWHDLHSKIDGPAAYDVLTNFEERWLKAAKPHRINKLKTSYDDALLRIERIPDILGVFDAPTVSANDPEAWHVQIFRSIDSNSVKGFPKDPKYATSKNLMCGKNVLIDMSIHTAYVKAIRAAQHFIYIENQYFIGSSYNWNAHKDIGANNLIPMEIALKIADKIRANERFAVYIVIPMWPEGVPTGAATQRILYWQHKTMQMMYGTIYNALVEAGLDDRFSPQDYLNFFCLGNREMVDGNNETNQSNENTPQASCRKSRRFMIYVHSKGMVIDDEYVVIGSANINQRSMEGTRDTEIAMGAYQPQQTWARRQSGPRGQIFGYRMSLWAEHMAMLDDSFEEPESLECVSKVRRMGEENWKQFRAEQVSEMRGHLLKYPVEVDRKGKVRPLPGSEEFPDVGGNIVGSFLAIQENLTI
ncbi:unnamed protein product [Brassica oleracea var. botrytis]